MGHVRCSNGLRKGEGVLEGEATVHKRGLGASTAAQIRTQADICESVSEEHQPFERRSVREPTLNVVNGVNYNLSRFGTWQDSMRMPRSGRRCLQC